MYEKRFIKLLSSLALQLNTIKSSLDLTLIILSTALDSQWAGHSIVKAKQLW